MSEPETDAKSTPCRPCRGDRRNHGNALAAIDTIGSCGNAGGRCRNRDVRSLDLDASLVERRASLHRLAIVMQARSACDVDLLSTVPT